MSDPQPDGDLHVEIVDTRDPVEGAASGTPAPALTSTQSARRRWAVRLSLAVVLLIVGAALLRTATYVPSAASTPTPLPVPMGPVMLLSNVSYGSVTLNGRQLDGPPPLAMTFRPGSNVLTLVAPPFTPGSCHIDWPTAQVKGGECSTDRSGTAYTIRGHLIVPVAVVTLALGAQDLPVSIREAASAVVASVLSEDKINTIVPTGSFISTGRDASGRIMSQASAAPAQAALVFEPDTAQAPSSGGLCESFCAEGITPDVAGALAGHVWVTDASVAVQWTFTSGGAVIARSPVYPATAVLLALVYDGAAGWQVSQVATQAINGFSLSLGLESLPVCAAGANALASYAQATGYGFGETSNRGAEGCELQLKSLAGTPEGTFLWRFGVLLAVDAPAHAVAPELPVAPTAEVAAVSG